ncbi:hypothetical protein NAT51_16560 [Flavobacterium amniphilum]|uniref:hypothetical protein n=1 Tax=Flavobacterium amniphilum TaxID=1834035 RepID=UPI00202A89FC|nr:hypothetical protein [Flavobacterium amniphilum]MCL9807148.1 hypothetical protein [Flavobacterium amniphilum]
MKKFWIHKAGFDLVFIISPPFLVLGFVLLFQDKIQFWQENYSFLTWLILIVFIDVAHVYATLYKTYFSESGRKYYQKKLLYVPLFCFGVSLFLYALGYQVFWSVLAYVAVFHFIRQQYGFMRLYARNEPQVKKWIDNLAIYNATVYPMLFWFFSPKRNFTWFVENEFLGFPSETIVDGLTFGYFLVITAYVLYVLFRFVKYNQFNLPKYLLILGTYLSWYFGIVYFNNDLVFTLLNVVSHGIPYIALMYFNQRTENHLKFLPKLSTIGGLMVFLFVFLLLAVLEEFLWEIFVWNENISVFSTVSWLEEWQILVVPLLMVPQFTHYVLDGIIWKKQ